MGAKLAEKAAPFFQATREVDFEPLISQRASFSNRADGYVRNTWQFGACEFLLYRFPSLPLPPPEEFGSYRNQELEGGLLAD